MTVTLVRLSLLGASYRVPCLRSGAGSPHWPKLYQQPVPSVARSAESAAKSVNKGRDAHLGNIGFGDVSRQVIINIGNRYTFSP